LSNPPPVHSTGARKANRLSREKSPYLLQHQFNPVDWFAWGEEAFQRARAENKPIFLSIGYSTCHWCHVMERESFENERVGEYLNAHYISIKVDREERPDVDRIYMLFVQSTTGSGGWPLNCFLAPDLKPFYGGTYFPPDNRHGRPSFLELLRQIAGLWQSRREDLLLSAESLHTRMLQMTAMEASASAPFTIEITEKAASVLKQAFDHQHGGFGGAPKFPQPSQPEFLLQAALLLKDKEAVTMVLKTCDAMAAGGINDQLGGGFARYSVDAEWLVPHFEKMLYDNAQLACLYLDAFRAGRNPAHAATARSIIKYVLRDMTHENGGFYSAEDADSEGKEGKFYCWTRAEMSALLTPEEFNVATRYFGVTEQGNFVDHSDPNPLPDQNVLSIANPDIRDEDTGLLESAREKMFVARAKRVRPHLDDKVLISWNGLMLGALARAYAVLGDDEYLKAAEKNLAFVRREMWDAKVGALHHRWREGARDTAQLLQAYSFYLFGVVELYEVTLKPEHLEFAIEIADAMLKRFLDREHGGFWQNGTDVTDTILRMKDDYDGAEPSANSVAALALFKLAAITGNKAYQDAAEGTLQLFGVKLETFPQALPYMMQAVAYSLEAPRRVVIADNPRSPEAKALLRAAHSIYQPRKVVMGNVGPVEEFARTLPAVGVATAYLCTGNACQPPTTDPQEIRKFLEQSPVG
jgi:uncharacterized protein YyaL (SSP411 family)